MNFYRYRHVFADGPEKNWTYAEGLHEETGIELEEEYAWAMHYRGVEIEECEPPVEWLKEQVCEFRRRALAYERCADRYQKLLNGA